MGSAPFPGKHISTYPEGHDASCRWVRATAIKAVMAVPNIAASLLAATDLMPVREKAPETATEPAVVSAPAQAVAAVQAVVAPSPGVLADATGN